MGQYWDLYNYCGNNPIDAIDQNGGQASKIFTQTIKLIGNGADAVSDIYKMDGAVKVLQKGEDVVFNNNADAEIAAVENPVFTNADTIAVFCAGQFFDTVRSWFFLQSGDVLFNRIIIG